MPTYIFTYLYDLSIPLAYCTTRKLAYVLNVQICMSVHTNEYVCTYANVNISVRNWHINKLEDCHCEYTTVYSKSEKDQAEVFQLVHTYVKRFGRLPELF